jgi:hypothetical protein
MAGPAAKTADRQVAARSEKPSGWWRFSGPRTGDWPPGRPWAVRHQEGQQGSKIAGQKVGREGQPHLAPPITSSPTQLGSLVVGEGWWASWLWPRSASRFFRNRKPLLERDRAGQKGSQTSSERECPENSSVCEKRSLSGFASGRATYGRSRRLCDGPSTVTFLGSTRSV